MAHEPPKAYPSEVVNGTSLMHNVPISDMFVHFRTDPGGYARPTRQWRVNKLVAEFDPQAIGVLLLSLRDDGRLAIVDGHHRVEMAKKIGMTVMDAMIYVDLTIEDEARLYRKFGDYMRQTPLDRFHAGIAERVPEYLAIARVLEAHGLHVPNTLGPSGSGVVAVDALIRVSTMYGLIILDRALTLLKSAWPNDSRAFRGMCLNGTSAFIVRYQDNHKYKERLLISRLTRVGVSAIEQRAMSIRAGALVSNPNAAWGMALRATHNYRLPDDDQLEEWAPRHYTEQARNTASVNMRKLANNLTPEQRSDMAKKANVTLGPEGRAAKALKSAKTRRGYSIKNVSCVYCGAQPGEFCTSSTYRKLPNYHTQRRAEAKAWAESKLKP